jgi:hypothetical protein
MRDVISSIQGLFALAAIIVGMFCGRPRSAAIGGAIVGAVCAALFLVLLISAGVQGADLAYLAGRFIVGPILFLSLFALLGYAIKRGFRRLFGGSKPAVEPAPPHPIKTDGI